MQADPNTTSSRDKRDSNKSTLAEEFEKFTNDKDKQLLFAGVAVTAVLVTTFMVLMRPKK